MEDVRRAHGRLIRRGRQWEGPCPACGGRNRFHVNCDPGDNGGPVLFCRKGCSFAAMMQAMGLMGQPADPPPRASTAQIDERRAAAAANPPPSGAAGGGTEWDPFPDPEKMPKVRSHSDMARIMIDEGHAEFLAHVPESDEFLLWNGAEWAEGESRAMKWLGRWGTLKFGREGQKGWTRKESQGGSITALRAALGVVGGDAGVRVPLDRWDAARGVCGLPGGQCAVITPDGWSIRPQEPCDLIRRPLPFAPAGEWRGSRWDELIRRIVTDEDARDWLRAAAGHVLSGGGAARAVVWLLGPRASGKSTIVETIRSSFGNHLAAATDEDLLLADREMKHRSVLARLAGKRMATWHEASGVVSAKRLKALSGGDMQSANFMRQNPFDFRFTALIFISGNEDIRIRRIDPALTERIRLIDSFQTIPAEEQDPAVVLLRDEGCAEVVSWALEGAVENAARVAAGGPMLPPETAAMTAAKDAWISRMRETPDPITGERRSRWQGGITAASNESDRQSAAEWVARFARERLVVIPGTGYMPLSAGQVNEEYNRWAAATPGAVSLGVKGFGALLGKIEGVDYGPQRIRGVLVNGFNLSVRES